MEVYSVYSPRRQAVSARRTKLSLCENTEKALAVLAIFYKRFEAANKDLCDINKRFDVECDQVELLAEKAAKAQRGGPGRGQLLNCATRGTGIALDETEADLNHGLRNVLVLVVASATAALSCGTGERLEIERTYSHSAMTNVGVNLERRCCGRQKERELRKH